MRTKNNNAKPALIIFIKNPELGKAKTRLAATVGDIEALRIYKLLLNHTRKITSLVDVERYLFYDSYITTKDDWSEKAFNKRLQSDGDLGVRMSEAFKTICSLHNKVIIVGSDCAQLKKENIIDAIDSLDKTDVVIGRVHDGGYYLLGMRNFYPELFTDIIWSTDAVAEQTITRTQSLGLIYSEVETLSDIDYYEDWVTYGKHLDDQI